MSGLATNYCPYCGREIPQFPTGKSKPGQYCYDDCPEGEGKRITLLPLKPTDADWEWADRVIKELGLDAPDTEQPPTEERPYTPGRSWDWSGKPGFDKNRDKRKR